MIESWHLSHAATANVVASDGVRWYTAFAIVGAAARLPVFVRRSGYRDTILNNGRDAQGFDSPGEERVDDQKAVDPSAFAVYEGGHHVESPSALVDKPPSDRLWVPVDRPVDGLSGRREGDSVEQRYEVKAADQSVLRTPGPRSASAC